MLKNLFALGSACVCVMGLSSTVQAQKLQSAKIIFTTPDDNDDKDTDTRVSVTLWTREGEEWKRVVAQAHNFDGDKKYPDDNSTNEKALDIQGEIVRAQVNGLKVRIEIAPDGNDTWIFRYRVELMFEGGGTIAKDTNDRNIILNQDNRVHEFVY